MYFKSFLLKDGKLLTAFSDTGYRVGDVVHVQDASLPLQPGSNGVHVATCPGSAIDLSPFVNFHFHGVPRELVVARVDIPPSAEVKKAERGPLMCATKVRIVSLLNGVVTVGNTISHWKDGRGAPTGSDGWMWTSFYDRTRLAPHVRVHRRLPSEGASEFIFYPDGTVREIKYKLDGKLHRDDGPAWILYDTDGNETDAWFYRHGGYLR